MSFRLTNAFAAFVAIINSVFKQYKDIFVNVFIYDTLVYSRRKKEHPDHIRIVLNPPHYTKFCKSEFLLESITFLGQVISRLGIHMDPHKMNAMKH